MNSIIQPALRVFLFSMMSTMLQAGQTPAAPPAVPSHVVQLQVVLTDGSKIHGTPVGFAALPLQLEFTKIDVPLHLIAQGAYTAQRAGFAIRFRNNDTLTGTLEMKRITVQTAYGLADIPVDRIATIIVTVTAAKP